MHIVFADLEVLVEAMRPGRRRIIYGVPRIREVDSFRHVSQLQVCLHESLHGLEV